MNDILMKVTVYNRGPEAATIHVLPHCWFRNFWKHNPRFTKPEIVSVSPNCLQTRSARNGHFFLYHEGGEQLFCDNETNNQRMYNRPNDSAFVKDGINNYVVNNEHTVNPKKQGTKANHIHQAFRPQCTNVENLPSIHNRLWIILFRQVFSKVYF